MNHVFTNKAFNNKTFNNKTFNNKEIIFLVILATFVAVMSALTIYICVTAYKQYPGKPLLGNTANTSAALLSTYDETYLRKQSDALFVKKVILEKEMHDMVIEIHNKQNKYTAITAEIKKLEDVLQNLRNLAEGRTGKSNKENDEK